MATPATEAKAAAPKTTLPKEVFAVEVPNHELLKLAYDSFLANNRTSAGRTKTRGEISGGGKKPWKQKGTGRARFGSSRNPIWRGGGIVFGPRGNENFSKKIATNAKRVAIKQALSLANKEGIVQVKDIKTTGKTAEVVKFLADNKLDRKVLIVVTEKTPELLRATNNIQNVMVVRATYLNVYYILNADHILLATDTVAVLKDWLVAKESK
jgi:large subunit ribosomal protein L4